MKILFDKSFHKSLSKIRNRALAREVEAVIVVIQNSDSTKVIPQLKKLQGFRNYYRIRLGDYRIGFELESSQTIRFITIAHRKDIYKYFP